MLQRDYFIRMTEMLAAAIAKILFNKEKKDYFETEKEIESAAKTIVGLDLKLISMFGMEELTGLMKTSDLYAGKCLVTAELLYEYADVKKILNEDNLSSNLYLKSIRLYLEAVLSGDLPDNEKYFPKINSLIAKLSGENFSDEMNNALLDYYSLSGQYSKYEDKVFELLENGNDEVYKKAVKFYESLKNISEEELQKGNFSREEAEESLNEILYLKNKN